MTEEEYKLLCSTCDSILFEDHENMDRVAISWLHVIREHPVFLDKYEGLFKKQAFVLRVVRYARYISKSILLTFRLIWRLILFQRTKKARYSNSIDIIFVSHLLSTAQLANEEDFYFGCIPNQLAQQGLSVLVVLINHTSLPDCHVSEQIKSLQGHSIILPKLLSSVSEFNIWVRTKKQARLLRKKAKAEKNQFR